MKALARMSIFTSRTAKASKSADKPSQRGGRKKLTRRASLAIRPPMGGMARPIKFYLLDGHTVMVHVSNTTTASEACVRIRKQLKLQNDLDFSVFDWTKDSMALIEDDALLGPIIEAWSQEATEAGNAAKASDHDVPAHRLLYRRRIYVPVGAFAAEVDQAGTTPDGEEGMAALRLEFKEAHYNTMQGNYPVDESMAMKLMALELRMKLGAWTSDKVAKNEVRDMLDAHIPPLIMKGKNKKAKTKMEGFVVAQWKQHAAKSEADLMKLYVDALKEEYPFYYGSFFFKATCNRPITDKLRTINVGIGFNGISLFITRRGVLAPVEEYKYEDVLQWSVLKEGAMFAFWVNDNDVVALNTPQAVQIDTLVQMYVAENINQLENGATTAPRVRGKPPPMASTEEGDGGVGAAAGAGSGAGAGALSAGVPPPRPPGPPPKQPGSVATTDGAGARGFLGQGVVPTRAPEPGSVEDLEAKAAAAGWELATDADTLIKYYYHPATKAASWSIPKAGPGGVITGDGKKPEDKPLSPATDLLALAAANVVPAGWVRLTDPTTGKPFYLHYASRRTTEFRPRTSRAPPPAPARSGPGKGRSRGAKKRVAGLRALRQRKEALLKKENGAAALAEAEAQAEAAVAAAAPGGEVEADYGDAYYGAGEDVPETPFEQLWYYIDNEETEQGPFDSVTMAEWFEQGYFADETYVRRADESEWSVYIERWPGGVGRFDVAAE